MAVKIRLGRREFLKGAAAAVIAAGAVPLLSRTAAAEQAVGELPELPWPYKELDVEETRRRGHLGYYKFECAGGAFWALTSQLKEMGVYPWTALPIPSKDEVLKAVLEKKHLAFFYQYGAGGVMNWATLCGALNGSLGFIQMVVKEEDHWKKLGQAILRFYETARFPSDVSNQYAVEGKYYVPRSKMKYAGALPQSVSGSTLCHVSVGKWCEVSGYASGSKERSERCGRLTGDVAAAAAFLLNAYFRSGGNVEAALAEFERYAKRFGGTIRLSATTQSCRVCHYKGKDYEMGQFTRGYLECESCHRDMRPHAHTFFNPAAAKPTPELETAPQRQLKEAAIVGSIASAAVGAVAGFAAAKATSSEKKEKK